MGKTTLERPAVREMPAEQTDRVDESGIEPDRPPRYGVVLQNDPINTIEYVVQVLRKVLGYGLARALRLTLQAHFTGRSVVWSGPLEVAELRAEQIQSCGPDPSRVAAGATRLSVSLEPL
jgi:ATP-dependent Clp protease adaptor protein ClpS